MKFRGVHAFNFMVAGWCLCAATVAAYDGKAWLVLFNVFLGAMNIGVVFLTNKVK